MTQDGRLLPVDKSIAMLKQLGISGDGDIYLYCVKGARTSNTLLAMKGTGFECVKLYFGSWNEWPRDEQLPVDAETIAVGAPV